MLKIVSVNIEGDNHFDTVLALLEREKPDIVCMQEVYEADLPLLISKISSDYRYLQLSTVTQENPFRKAPKGVEGIVIFSKLPIKNASSFYYESQPADTTILDSKPEGSRRGLIWIDVEQDGMIYRIATTHFTWSWKGEVTQMQRDDLKNLLHELETVKPSLLCGDFNAPRGSQIFDTLASHYVDNIPDDVTTTIDQHLHRVSGIQFVVDGFFTGTGYTASNVRVLSGVSDHCALVGELTKVSL